MSLQMPLLLAVMMIAFLYGNSGSLVRRRGKKACIIMITAILACFSGFRSWWMGDLIKYYTLFLSCNGPDWQGYVSLGENNVGIRYLFRLVGQLGLKYEVAIFTIAAFSAIALGVIVHKYSPSPFWSYTMWIAMGFYMFTYSGLKQTIAMAFLMLALIGIMENRFWLFLGMNLLAGWFHAPSLVFLIAYPFSRMEFDKKYLVTIIGLMAVVFVLRGPIVGFMSELYYEDSDGLTAAEGIGGRFLMMAFIMMLSIVLRPLRKGDVVYNKVFNIMVVAMALQIFSAFDNNFTRLADYYFQFVVLFMPLMLQNAQNKTYVEAIPGQGRRAFTFNAKSYVLLYVAIIAFALLYYKSFVDNSWLILKDFRFFWEIDPYAIYGT